MTRTWMNILLSRVNVLVKHMNNSMVLMLLGNLFTILINIVTVKLLTNKFSVQEYGLFSIIMSVSAFPQLVLFAPVAASVFPFFKQKREQNRYEEFQRDIFDLFYLIFLSLLLILIGLFVSNVLFNFFANELVSFGFLTLGFSSTISWLAMLDTFSLANSRVKEYIFFPLVNLAFKLIMLVVIFRVDVSPLILIAFFSLIQGVLCITEYSYLLRKQILTYCNKPSLSEIFSLKTGSKKEIIGYSKNFFFWGLFAWGQSFFDKWVLNHNVGSSSVGIYSVYYQYGFFPFTIFSSVVSQYITPMYFSRSDDYKRSLSFLKQLLFYCLFFLVVFCVLFYALSVYLGPFFIEVLTNESYLEFIGLFPLFIICGCFYGFGQIITVPLLNSEFVSRIRLPKIGSAIISMILFWTLIPKLGFLGVISSLLVSNAFYFFSLFITILSYKKILKSKIK